MADQDPGPVPDIRNVVEQNRGLLKKIQLHIPGFREYRSGDDLRVADQLLRKQISMVLNNAIKNLQLQRTRLAQEGKFQILTSIGSALSALQQLDGEISHSSQGYSGISPSIRMDDRKLNSLYSYDLDFVQASEKISRMADPSSDDQISDAEYRNRMADLVAAINDTKRAWERRMETVQGIMVAAGGGNK